MNKAALTYIDAHCHVDLYPDPVALAIERAETQISTIAVTNAPSVFFYTKELGLNNRAIIPAAGLHPELAHSHHAELPNLISLIDTVSIIGEVGLDYTDNDDTVRAIQRQVFSAVLHRCAEVGNRVISVHSRRAAAEAISMIGPDYPGNVILHWFSGTIRDARHAVANGYYFSVNCAMAKSDRGRNIIDEIPSDQILTETDGPFLDCCTKGSFGTHILSHLSRSWKEPIDDVVARIRSNFHSILPR